VINDISLPVEKKASLAAGILQKNYTAKTFAETTISTIHPVDFFSQNYPQRGRLSIGAVATKSDETKIRIRIVKSLFALIVYWLYSTICTVILQCNGPLHGLCVLCPPKDS
jgi:hypothetical protein